MSMSILSLGKNVFKRYNLRHLARSMSMQMQTIRVDDKGTQLAYIDSGAPPGDTYTTLVCVHGHTYHAQNFRRLLPLAQKHNLRVIALNRRDYVGSTPFSQAELEAINSTDANMHTEFLKNRGTEIAQFLTQIVNEKQILPASEDGKSGGLALMGWSLGNVTTLAFLRHLKSYPGNVLKTLERYLRTFFIYESAYSSLGYVPPEGAYHPLTDPTIPPSQRASVFGTWVSSYCSHPYYTSSSSPPLTKEISNLQVRIPTLPYRPATVDHSFTPSDIQECTDPAPAARSEQAFFSKVKPTPQYEQMTGAIVLSEASPLPALKLRVVYGLNSIWSIQWGVWELEKDVDKWKAEGKTVRPIRFLPVEGANHFLHWDDPDLFLRTFAEGIRS